MATPRTADLKAAKLRPSSDRELGLVDLFSGCGGASAGFLGTGLYRHLYAADLDQWANETYERNIGSPAKTCDLTELLEPRALRAWVEQIRGRAAGAPIVLVGGPPCQGFSSHSKVRGDRHGRNTLVEVFGTLAAALKPDIIMMENVADLVATRSWRHFNSLRSQLRRAGFSVRARILNMAALGVPQERFRLVLLASRHSTPTFPAPSIERAVDFSTVKEWIGDLPRVDSGSADPCDPMHEASHHRPETLEIIRAVPPDGGSRPAGIGPECLKRARASFGGYTDVYGRLAWSEPAPTITARCRTPSCGRFVHPEQDRGLTAREAGLLQTFPRDWFFCGPFDDRYKQAGNAVPPLAARAFAAHLAQGMPPNENEVGLYEVGNKPGWSSFSVLIPGIRRRGGVL